MIRSGNLLTSGFEHGQDGVELPHEPTGPVKDSRQLAIVVVIVIVVLDNSRVVHLLGLLQRHQT